MKLRYFTHAYLLAFFVNFLSRINKFAFIGYTDKFRFCPVFRSCSKTRNAIRYRFKEDRDFWRTLYAQHATCFLLVTRTFTANFIRNELGFSVSQRNPGLGLHYRFDISSRLRSGSVGVGSSTAKREVVLRVVVVAGRWRAARPSGSDNRPTGR